MLCKNILFIILGGIWLLGLMGCSTLDFVNGEEPRIQEGWVDDETLQFIVDTRWNNNKYYLGRYEPAHEKSPIRFVNLKRTYAKYFRKRIKTDIAKKIADLAHIVNPEISQSEWEVVAKKALSGVSDLNIVLIEEFYYQDGLIEYAFQVKKHNFKEFIECHLAGGLVC